MKLVLKEAIGLFSAFALRGSSLDRGFSINILILEIKNRAFA